ncbi:hypothetical protein BS17DRAFT_212127 [Gyrodon lividus]|nr:hypothetical protein BS17DRAFT_212127 [Gyrodon lividus]
MLGRRLCPNVKLSRHSPHLRLRTFCRTLRDAVDEYQPFWQYLRIDWTEPSSLEISELWCRNRRIGDIHLSVVPYKYYTDKHAQLTPPPPDPALLDCLRQRASDITSAAFHIPDGVDYFIPLAQALQPHVQRMDYENLQGRIPNACITRHTSCNDGQWVRLDGLHVVGCDHQWNPSLGNRTPRQIRTLLARMLRRSMLRVNAKTRVEPAEPFFRKLPLPIQWEVLSELVVLHSSDSVMSVHDLLAREGGCANLQTLYVEIKMSGLPNPEWIINREHEIHIPTLTSLTLKINFEGCVEADTPEDGH